MNFNRTTFGLLPSLHNLPSFEVAIDVLIGKYLTGLLSGICAGWGIPTD